MLPKYFLEISCKEKIQRNEPMLCRAKFQIPRQGIGPTVKGPEILNHITLVVTRGGNYQAISPFKNVIVFSDDIKITESTCSGFFNFDIFEKIAFDGEGEYFVLCSIGTITSNIAKVIVA
jgi:hypothetical protein